MEGAIFLLTPRVMRVNLEWRREQKVPEREELHPVLQTILCDIHEKRLSFPCVSVSIG